ncbi:MAG: hypothetical protein ACR2KX_16125 [Chitinophagaceae bacterium]
MFKIITKENNFKDLIYSDNKRIEIGEVVLPLTGEIFHTPRKESIQIGINKHILDKFGKFTNHSCFPSCKVIGDKLISVKVINKGDSITFNYNETEDLLAAPFKCNCCNKTIAGKFPSAKSSLTQEVNDQD